MTLKPGDRLGPYEIAAQIGSGGMGDVYRARDPRLRRDVAIKVLPAGVALDPDRLARFEQEARAAAALSHPNILAVYDIGTHNSSPYIVGELLEGETLRQREAAGALPVRKAVDIAVQVAHGLGAAHEKGIVHRDLKPENIFLTADGRVKILDFGLAKLTQSDVALAGVTAMPTTPPKSQPGLIMGTFGYMAPEQVRALPADQRADIFSLGAVVYEMLSGRRAFHRDTNADTMTAILNEDPPDLPIAERRIPPAIARIVDRCLEKNPSARFQTANDLGFALEALSSHSDQSDAATIATTPPISRRSRKRLGWALAALFFLVGTVLAILFTGRAADDAPAIQFAVTPPATYGFGGAPQQTFALSPNGRRLAFIANKPGLAPTIWIRSIDALDAQPVGDSTLASRPFWSPDSRTLGFVQAGRLKTIVVPGGPSQIVADVPPSNGVTWHQNGTIVFCSAGGEAFKVPAAGGQPTKLPGTATSAETSCRFPRFLPDGRHFLFRSFSGTVRVASLDSADTIALARADGQAEFAAGHLFFVRQGTLFAQAFDIRSVKLTGDAIAVAEHVRSDAGGSSFSVSDGGVLAYRTGEQRPATQLSWVDRTGKTLGTVGQPGFYQNPALSPDGSRLALEAASGQGRGADIWVSELARGVISRFTFDEANDVYPVWSPDGSRIMFASDRLAGVFHLFQKLSNFAGEDELVFRSGDYDKKPYDWSPDGRHIVFISYQPGQTQIGVLPLVGDGKPLALPPLTYGVTMGNVSPDGKWIAYASNESGRTEVYVRSFPTPAGKRQISKDGAIAPRWRGDGRELYYYAFDGRIMAVPVRADTTFDVGTAVPLFTTELLKGSTTVVGFRAQYDVTRDGRQFLVNVPVSDQTATPPSITVVYNWPATLKR
jgi:eukaryotic-like serine/threonine-protein kinase